MKFKRTLSLLLAMIMLITCFGGMSITAYAKDSVKTINGIEFSYTIKNNEAKITKIIVRDAKKAKKELVIPEKLGGKKVTTIGEGAGYYNEKIKTIRLGDTLKSLEDSALYGFRNGSTTVYIGKSLKSIGFISFNRKSIKKIVVDKGNKYFSVKDNTLYNKDKTVLYFCYADNDKTKFTVPGTVTEIKAQAFFMASFTEIKLSDKVKTIGDDAFGRSDIKSMTLPKTVTKLGYAAFSDCTSLKSVDLSKTKIKKINRDTFAYAGKTLTVKFPSTVASIAGRAFVHTKINELQLPDNLEKLDKNTFAYSYIKSLSISKNNKSFSTADGVLFNKDKTTLIFYPNLKDAKEYTVPATVTSLGYEAFESNKKLQKIDLSKTEITSIPSHTFHSCEKLKTAVLPDSCTSIGSYAFSFTSLTNINYPQNLTKIASGAFYECSKLKNADLSETRVERIGEDAFNRSAVNTVKLPATLVKIGDYAFANCDITKDIYISSNNAKFGDGVFYNYTYANYDWDTGECTYDYPYIIHAPAGSTAEKYAKEYNITFVAE